MPDDASLCESCGAALSQGSLDRTCESCRDNTSVPIFRPGATISEVPSAADDVPPISKHQLFEEIAHGGMSTVHRARQESLRRDVAVKIVDPLLHYEASMDRFAREVRVLAQLDHPNIVPIYDYGTDPEGRRAYTMKLVRGRTLEAILGDLRGGGEKMTLQRLLRIFRKVCDAVAFAHSRGIIHRDLKPANIMVGEFGEVLVMDWGLASDLSEVDGPLTSPSFPTVFSAKEPPREDSGLTVYGEVLGTPEYMPPEQAVGTIRVDGRADIYSLGGILYTILTLRSPIVRSSIRETVDDVRQGRIDPFGPDVSIAPERADLWKVPPALLAVVRKAMASDREKRFASVIELASDVDAYLGGFATSAEKITLGGQLWLFIKRHRALSAAALLLIAITFGFVVRLIASEHRARANEGAAVAAGSLARKNEKSARESLARARTLQAESAYAANDARQMREALDAVPDNLRDAHWQYLNERADERQALLNWQGDGFLVGSVPHPSKPGVFTVATNGNTHRIVDFDAKTGAVLKSFSYGQGWVRSLAYSPDHKRIAVGRIMEGGISVHDAETGAELRRWNSEWVNALQFHPDGERILQSSAQGSKMLDADTGKVLWQAQHGWFHFLLPGGGQFVSVSGSNIRLQSTQDGSVIRTFPVNSAVPQTASLSPNGKLVAVAREDGQIQGFDLETGKIAFDTAAGEDGDIRRTAFTPDGTHIVTVAALEETGQAIRILDAETGRVLRRLRGGAGGVESLTIHPLSNDLLITCEYSATWALPEHRQPSWSLEPGFLGGFFGGSDRVLALRRKTGLAAVTLADGTESWRPSRDFFGVATTSFTADTGVAQSPGAGGNREFVIFRAGQDSVKEAATIKFGTDARALAINCDGTRVAIAAAWPGISAFRADTGAELPPIDCENLSFTNGLTWHGKDPQKLIGIFSRFARRGNPKSEEWIVQWDTSTGKRVAEMRKPTSSNCIAAEPRGARFAEGGDDKFIRIRDADSLAVLREFRAHDYPIHAVAWNPVFPVLATNATDRAIRLWDVETGRLIEEVHIGLREANALSFSPDGRRLAASSPGARTLVWELPNLEARLAFARSSGAR